MAAELGQPFNGLPLHLHLPRSTPIAERAALSLPEAAVLALLLVGLLARLRAGARGADLVMN